MDAGRVWFLAQQGEAVHLQCASRFLVDQKTAMQGYVTSEPFAVEKEGRFRAKKSSCSPTMASNTYSTLIEARRETVEKRPDLVQRFVNATAIGW